MWQIYSEPAGTEGDRHRKSRLPGLAMNKIAAGRGGRLPCSPPRPFVGICRTVRTRGRIALRGPPPGPRARARRLVGTLKNPVPSTPGGRVLRCFCASRNADEIFPLVARQENRTSTSDYGTWIYLHLARGSHAGPARREVSRARRKMSRVIRAGALATKRSCSAQRPSDLQIYRASLLARASKFGSRHLRDARARVYTLHALFATCPAPRCREATFWRRLAIGPVITAAMGR